MKEVIHHRLIHGFLKSYILYSSKSVHRNMELLLEGVILMMVVKIRSLTPVQRFEHLNGFRILPDIDTPMYSVFGKQHCAMLCLHDNICGSANFEATTATCELNSKLPYEESVKIIKDNNWEILYPSLGDVWRLVFRATTGIGIAVYNAWIGSVSLPFATDSCKLTQPSSCQTHYRSSVLDHWTNNNIKQVKFSLYKNNSMVVTMVFRNLVGDDNTRWFNKDRLINSSYSDMTPILNYEIFSVSGAQLRRFYISDRWGGCVGDIGWIAVYDGSGVCGYENGLQYPYFGYAVVNQKGKELDFLSADVLAVFIKQD